MNPPPRERRTRYTSRKVTQNAAKKPAPYMPPVARRTMRPAMSEPAMPMPAVCGMVMGSRPGRARRARAPRMSPKNARPMRYPIMWPPLPRSAPETPECRIADRRRARGGRGGPCLVGRRGHRQVECRTAGELRVGDPRAVVGPAVEARAGDVLRQRRGAGRGDRQRAPAVEADRRARERRAADDVERRARRDRPDPEQRPDVPRRQAAEIVVARQAVGGRAKDRLDVALRLGSLPRLTRERRHPWRLEVVLVAGRVLRQAVVQAEDRAAVLH